MDFLCSEWLVRLPEGEDVTVVALGTQWVAAATTQSFVRLFRRSGLQDPPIMAPGRCAHLTTQKRQLTVHSLSRFLNFPPIQLFVFAFDCCSLLCMINVQLQALWSPWLAKALNLRSCTTAPLHLRTASILDSWCTTWNTSLCVRTPTASWSGATSHCVRTAPWTGLASARIPRPTVVPQASRKRRC